MAAPAAEPFPAEQGGAAGRRGMLRFAGVGHARVFRRLVLLSGDDPRGREVRDGMRGEEDTVDGEQRRPPPEVQEREEQAPAAWTTEAASVSPCRELLPRRTGDNA